jgi:hypothetical protein
MYILVNTESTSTEQFQTLDHLFLSLAKRLKQPDDLSSGRRLAHLQGVLTDVYTKLQKEFKGLMDAPPIEAMKSEPSDLLPNQPKAWFSECLRYGINETWVKESDGKVPDCVQEKTAGSELDQLFTTLNEEEQQLPFDKEFEKFELAIRMPEIRQDKTPEAQEEKQSLITWFLTTYCTQRSTPGPYETPLQDPMHYWNLLVRIPHLVLNEMNEEEAAKLNLLKKTSYHTYYVEKSVFASHTFNIESPRTERFHAYSKMIGVLHGIIVSQALGFRNDPYLLNGDKLAILGKCVSLLQETILYHRTHKHLNSVLKVWIETIVNNCFYSVTQNSMKSSDIEERIRTHLTNLFAPMSDLQKKLLSVFTTPLFSKTMSTLRTKVRRSTGYFYLGIAADVEEVQTPKNDADELLQEKVDDGVAAADESLFSPLSGSYSNAL